jgi:hypothetical protein
MRWKVVALIASLVVIAAATLVPAAGGKSGSLTNPWCFPCGRLGVAEAFATVLLFAPFGAAAFARTRSVARAYLLASAISLTVELLQLSNIVHGRSFAVADLVANGLGGYLGALCARFSNVLVTPTRQQARVLSVVWLTMLFAVFWTGSWMLQRPTRVSQHGPTLSTLPYTPGFGWFEGTVMHAAFDSVSFSGDGTGAIRIAAGSHSSHSVSATLRGVDSRGTLIPIVFVHEPSDSMSHLMIAQRGDRYVLRVEYNGAHFGLHIPDLAVARKNLAGITRIDAAVTSKDISIAINESDLGEAFARLRLSPPRAWLLLWPSELLSWWQRLLVGVAFLLCMLVPLLFWASSAWTTKATAVLLTLGVAFGGLVAPALTYGLSLPGPADWIAVVGALLTSAYIAKRSDRPPDVRATSLK